MVVKRYLNKISNILLFVLFFLFLEILHWYVVFPDVGLPKYALLDVFLVFGLGCVCLIFRSSLFDIFYLGVLYIVIDAFSIVNVTFHQTTGDVFSLANLALIDNAGNVAASAASFNPMFTSVAVLFGVLFIACMIGTFFLFKVDKHEIKKAYKKGVWKKRLIATSIALFSLSSYGLTLIHIAEYENSLDTIMLEKLDNFQKYGMLSYYAQEIPYILGGVHTKANTDQRLKSYFDVKKDTTNEFTGILKDAGIENVVTILVETGDDLMMNEALAPTLFSLFNKDQAINFTRNYSKNKTNMSEFISFSGSAPVAGLSKGYKYDLPWTLPSIFSSQGYRTMFFHDAPLDKDVYKRREIMPKLNFQEQYFHEELLPDEPGWDFSGSYTWDSHAMPNAADIILQKKDQPFYAYYTSLSMHGPYVEPANHDKLVKEYGEAYQAILDSGKFTNPLKGTINEICIDNYAMAVMDFDLGLKKFLTKFYEAGEYENTLFVLFGDHEMYYIGADNVPLNRTLAGTKDASNSCMYKTMMTFSNPVLNAKFKELYHTTSYNYDKAFTSPYNIVPTILDLMGIKYNPNWYLGSSVFGKDMEKTQVFYTVEQAGFFNEDFWAINDEAIYRHFTDKGNEQEFISEVKKTVEKAGLLDLIYTNDYFSYHDFKDYNTNYKNI